MISWRQLSFLVAFLSLTVASCCIMINKMTWYVPRSSWYRNGQTCKYNKKNKTFLHNIYVHKKVRKVVFNVWVDKNMFVSENKRKTRKEID